MPKVWTEEHVKYLQENWAIKSCEEIGRAIGKHRSSIWSKGNRMGLPNKTIINNLAKEARLEIEGRNNMDKYKEIFNFKTGERVKFRIKKARGSKRTGGKVVFNNNYIVVIDNGAYKESINKVDLLTKDVIIENLRRNLK
jgi:hypothetical protein